MDAGPCSSGHVMTVSTLPSLGIGIGWSFQVVDVSRNWFPIVTALVDSMEAAAGPDSNAVTVSRRPSLVTCNPARRRQSLARSRGVVPSYDRMYRPHRSCSFGIHRPGGRGLVKRLGLHFPVVSPPSRRGFTSPGHTSHFRFRLGAAMAPEPQKRRRR